MWSVLFVFLSSLDRNLVKGESLNSALDAEKQSKETFCARVSSVAGNFLYEVSDGFEVVRSMVTPAGKLVNCSISANPDQVTSLKRDCRLGRGVDGVERQIHVRYERMDEARQLCRRFTERLRQSEKSTQQDHALKRTKRGFTYPGTLWCGAGNMADNYDQLGDFAETDSCCRTHDHCPHVIHAFSSNYGHTNFKLHSISHCDCDNAMKDCLRKVNDTSSRVVGQAFFNVIGAPCFEFGYEEQCVERHWYGLCKRYEKLPIAVLREAVPYDFGGIDVIDTLTLAPSKKKDSNKSGEQVQSETTTQSTVSGSQTNSPEEPSLRNVVTAAEDFIKVLATVSTSQSSTADSEKGDAENSDKKKKKTSGKKKKTKKTKGKGRKKKQKEEVSVKIDDSTAVSLSSSKAEGALGLSNFISGSHSPEQPGRKANRVNDSEYELRSKEETSNEVMKDEPAKEEAVSITPLSPAQKKPAKTGVLSTLSSVAMLHKAKTRLLRNGKKRSKIVPLLSSNETASEPETSTAPTATTTTSKLRGQSFVTTTESQLIVNTTPIEITEVKRNRSKLRRDREGRKNRRKASSSTVVVVNDNTTVDDRREAKTLPGTPTIPSVTESHEPDFYTGRESVHVTAPNTSFSVLKRKRQRSREKGLTKRKRKGPSLLNEHLSSQNDVEDVVPILPTPSGALNSPAITTVISRPTEDTQTHREWQLFTPTSVPSVGRKRLLLRKQGKSRKKSLSAAPKGSVPKAMTFTSLPSEPAAVTDELYLRRFDNSNPLLFTTPSVNADLSPMQLSIERVKEQFKRKKRMKGALSIHQQ